MTSANLTLCDENNIVEATGNFVACCFDNVAVLGNNVEATFDFVEATFDFVERTKFQRKPRSTLLPFLQQSRTLFRHCCWCGPGFRPNKLRVALPSACFECSLHLRIHD